jgi:hypothetical protein
MDSLENIVWGLGIIATVATMGFVVKVLVKSKNKDVK